MQMFQQYMRTQTSTIESSSKEALVKICGSKSFTDAISLSLLTGTQKSLEMTFRKSLEDILIPAYQKITHEMFQEMGKAFTAGTKECKNHSITFNSLKVSFSLQILAHSTLI